ncbi:ABC transporter permease [Paludibaculum fermentans]|uniref:ABC transporter permease n=1 Tax=Paludibaculum fermentans TaxID=1473598 RepID=A0A7S7NVH3_PALFE|nr:ABC transporter permease [Paludibaculum fermentans]QOY90575.1 ABC transporter permease [Paludibaculum fermentans]
MSLRRRLYILLHRARSLFRRDTVERDLDRELDFHLHQQMEENMESGMDPQEARAAAQRVLGGVAQIQEECRDMRRTHHIETLVSDIRYAARVLRRAPGFTITIVLTLAIAIGANSAIFSVVQGVLLKPLPFANAGRLVRIYYNSDTQPKFPLNPNDFHDYRARNRSFTSMAAITRSDAQLAGAGETVRLRAFSVTAGYFELLGFRPAMGREFTSDDEQTGRGRTAVLSDRLWRTRFHADPAILGKTLTLDAQPVTVVGVMPPDTSHPGNNFHAVADGDTVDLWFPFVFEDRQGRGSHYMDGLGLLKEGVTPAQAQADLVSVLEGIRRETGSEQGWRVHLIPLFQEMVGRTRRILLVLFGAVGLLLLIACVNAANLLLARSTARAREIAVRSALGAARGRILRQLLTESLVLAGAGALLGTALAHAGLRVIVAFLPAGFPRAAAIRLDTGVLLFTVITAMLTGLLFGLAPALSAARADVQQGLREGARGSTGGRRKARLRDLLVVAETGLAGVLLIAAGLLLHGFVNLLRSDPGFRPQQVLTASVVLPAKRYPKDEQRARFYEQLMDHLEALPGVKAAGAGSDLPWTGYDGNADGFRVEGRRDSYSDHTTARYHIATAHYFEALGIPLRDGRFFDARDTAKGPFVLIVNETMARRYWPGETAIGKRITFRGMPKESDWMRIVGVVGDIRDDPGSNSVRPAFWLPLTQETDRALSVAVRATSDPGPLTRQLREAVARLDPELAVSDFRFMTRVAEESVATQRFVLFLVGLFAGIALILAAIGIYGVISYSVSRRMPEFGMRMALGATRSDLMRLILGQSTRLSLAGAAAGLVCAALSAQLLESLLYEVRGLDPITFGAVGALILVTAAAAAYQPARRAARADPMTSLRAE